MMRIFNATIERSPGLFNVNTMKGKIFAIPIGRVIRRFLFYCKILSESWFFCQSKGSQLKQVTV